MTYIVICIFKFLRIARMKVDPSAEKKYTISHDDNSPPEIANRFFPFTCPRNVYFVSSDDQFAYVVSNIAANTQRLIFY